MNNQKTIEILKECLENHKKLWLWIAKETRRRGVIMLKDDYFREHPLIEMTGTTPLNHCYLCEFAKLYRDAVKGKGLILCEFCPGRWVEDKEYKNNVFINEHYCELDGAYYSEYLRIVRSYEETPEIVEKAANLAEKIANIEIIH